MGTKDAKFPWPILAMVLGGALFAFGSADIPEFKWGDWFRYVTPAPVVESIEGTTLLMIHEKTKPSVQEVLDVRAASDFVKTHKLRGYLDVDKDDDWAKPVLVTLKEKPGIEPPVLAAVKIEDNKVKTVIRARKWTNSIEDILK